MSWLSLPARVHGPTGYYLSMGTLTGIRIGTGADAGLTKLLFADQHAIYPAPAQLLTFVVGGTQLLLQPSLLNNMPWWRAGNAVLYQHVQEGGWIYSTALKAGYRPLEWQEYNGSEWVPKGDAYYSAPSLPTVYGDTVELTPRGSLINGPAISVKLLDSPRWEGPPNGLGIYEPKGGATGDKIIGVPTWKSASLRREPEPDNNGRYAYITEEGGVLEWNSSADAYVLGDYNSTAGWHQTEDAPEPEEGYILEFTKPTDSEAEGEDITGSWDKWVDGDEKATIYLTEVAVMR